jgi:hypothetical protein
LVSAEIACNNSVQASTGETPFYLNFGQHPNFSLSAAVNVKSKNQAANDLLEQLQTTLENAKTSLLQAQQRQKQYANEHRRDVQFNVGDQVMVSTANLRNLDKAPKLLPKYIGPYKITKIITPVTYELQLPPSMRIHRSFHISKLKLFTGDDGQFPDREQVVRPPPVIVDDAEEFVVDQIINKRERGQRHKSIEYLVLWKGYPAWEASWEPVSHLKNAQEEINEFENSQI